MCRITMDLAGGGRSVYVPVDRLPSGVDFQYVPSPQDSHFEIRARAHWILWAIPVNHPDWESLLAKELKDSEGIGNLVITTRARFGDVLVGLLTLGCYRTTQVILTGDRVQLTLVAPLALPETDKPELSPVE